MQMSDTDFENAPDNGNPLSAFESDLEALVGRYIASGLSATDIELSLENKIIEVRKKPQPRKPPRER
jgi:hypothetical protein